MNTLAIAQLADHDLPGPVNGEATYREMEAEGRPIAVCLPALSHRTGPRPTRICGGELITDRD